MELVEVVTEFLERIGRVLCRYGRGVSIVKYESVHESGEEMG